MCEFIWNLVCVHSHICVSICLFIYPSVCPSASPLNPSDSCEVRLGDTKEKQTGMDSAPEELLEKGTTGGVVRCTGQEWAADSGDLRGESTVL